MKKGSNLTRKILNRWQLYLLLLVPLVYTIIFRYVPMFGNVIAFKDYRPADGLWGSEWVGFANFERFFESYKFKVVLKNTLTISLYSLLITFPIPILFALLINAFPGKRYKKIIQTVTYIPHFFSTVVMVGLLLQILNNRTGLYGSLYTMFTGETAPNILTQGPLFKHIYVWSAVWQSTGYNAIIYIAALSGVDNTLHEAARIDGASRLQCIRYIDLPSILPTASIMLILAVGGIMSVGYEKVLLLQNDLTLNFSEIISTYEYKVGLASGITDFSLSATISLFNSAINFILLTIANWGSKKLSGNSIF